ncbi:2-oxoacid dehydrogenases acyltransferase-domain-containing protein [Usnea florida]
MTVTLLHFRQCLFRTSRNASLLHRTFHASLPRPIVRPFLLSDIGEGIKEVQIIQWFVEPGARVEQFDKICEVQSDKAITEITSRFDGVIKRLHYEAEDVAQVGKPLCDIDVQSDISPENEAILAPPAEQAGPLSDPQQPQKAAEQQSRTSGEVEDIAPVENHAALATPAVRGLLKELKIDIADVTGTGKDGRVTKDDVQNFVATQTSETSMQSQPPTIKADQAQVEKPITLTPVQSQMFKTMTRSLSIPHFLYANEIDVTALSTLRQRLNNQPSNSRRLSYLPFVIKAVSVTLEDFPLLNARVDTGTGDNVPKLVMREKHNIGVAMDTPQGLLVPNIKDVSARSILSIASEISRLQALANDGKLSATDLTGGTMTVSNVGSIGGTYVAPVLVQSEVAILGIGKARTIPAFDEHDRVVKKAVMNFSWSADHRVVDGATMARMAERVRSLVEEPALMMARLR